MSESNSIKNWLEDDRPREKMMLKGAAALSDAELLTILIASGTKTKSALDLAKEILALAKNNLRELGRLGIKDMQQVKGIGMARAISISAALELGRRRQLADGLSKPSIKGSRDAAAIVMPLLQDLSHESFCVVYLNTANKVIGHELLSNGGLNATVVDIRMILKSALMANATKIMVAHNHPSGNKTPSVQDKAITTKLYLAAEHMDIALIDHIIIAGNEFFSFSDDGLI